GAVRGDGPTGGVVLNPVEFTGRGDPAGIALGMTTSTAAAPRATEREAEGPEGFSALLDGFRSKLDRELASWLGAKRAAAAGEAGRASEGPEILALIDGVEELMTHGGKRLRPALVSYTYRACGGTSDGAVLPLALATEFLHTYLLIHDDIMDHAEVRRGQPSAHARFREAHRSHGWRGDAGDFGASAAILEGDLAHTWAVELFGGVLVEGERAAELRRCFSDMCQEVIGGQYLELLVALRRATEQQAGEDELLRVLRLKSGRYTCERPIQLGGILAGADAATLAALSRYGGAVGEAFQLQDDLLGMFGDEEAVGKPVGADLKEGKFTFLVYHALRAASPEERRT